MERLLASARTPTAPGIKDTPSYLIAKVARAHRKRADELLNQVGLHAGQEMMIDALWNEDAMSQSDLADALGIRKATVTIALIPLGRDGLIERERDANDQRVIRVRLTHKGREKGAGIRRAWAALDEQTTRDLTEAELTCLENLLGKIRSNLASTLNTRGTQP